MKKFTPLLIIAAGVLAYANSFHGAFVFDDATFIVNDPRIRQLWPPWEILAQSSRPVVTLSLALNYALGGLNPWGYHLFNVAVHILAGLTLYGVMRRTLNSEWLAGTVALIWVVHPLQTESVTYIIQRGESLMGLFYLLTLYCVIRGWRLIAVVACALGMACKQVMITAPVIMLLYDRVFLAESWREVVKRRWMLHAGLMSTWLLLPVLMSAGTEGVSGWLPTAGFGYKGITPWQYALTQPGVIVHYLRLSFWPRPLCLDYGSIYGWPLARTVGDAMPGLAIVGGLLAATGWAWRRKPALSFLGVWFFVILAPTSSFVPIVGLIFEHRMYLSLAAVVTAVVVGMHALGRRLLKGRASLLGWGAGGVVICSLTFVTIQRNRDYRSELAIWQDTVRKSPNNPLALFNLGNACWAQGKAPEATAYWEATVRIKPDYAEVHNNLGLAFSQAGNTREAIREYELALQNNPNLVQPHNNLAYLLATRPPAEGGNPARAVVLAQRACELSGYRVAAYLDTLALSKAAAERAR